MQSPGPGPRAGTPADPSARRPPSLPGIAIVAAAGLVAAWVTIGIFLPAIGELGRAGQNPAALPRTLQLCDRTWDRGATVTVWTLAEVFARDDQDPVVVTDSGPGACPTGVCPSASSSAGCATVVYVKTGPDAYVPYSPVDGP